MRVSFRKSLETAPSLGAFEWLKRERDSNFNKLPLELLVEILRRTWPWYLVVERTCLLWRLVIKKFFLRTHRELNLKKRVSYTPALLDWGLKEGLVKTERFSELCLEAAREGRLHSLYWLSAYKPKGVKFPPTLLAEAAKGEDKLVIKWVLHTQTSPANVEAQRKNFEAALRKENISLLTRLQGLYPTFRLDYLKAYAARKNRLQSLVWLYTQDPSHDRSFEALLGAVKGGALETFLWLLLRCKPTRPQQLRRLLDRLVKFKRLELLEHLWKLISPLSLSEHLHFLNPSLMKQCVESGSLPLLLWFLERGALLPEQVGRTAVLSGSLELLDWLFEKRELQEPYYCLAARTGRVEVLQWLRKRFGRTHPWNSDVLVEAVRNERRELFFWAWERGCPVNSLARKKARKLGWITKENH